MSDRLRVDLSLLDATAAELKGLSLEFGDTADYTDPAVIGHPKMADALEEFATNWKRHREGLTKSLDAVHQMAVDSAAHYRAVDEELARALRGAGTGDAAAQ